MGFVYNVTKGRTEYLIGLDEDGAGGGISKKKIIIKSDTIPEASAKTYKLIYIYSGESNGTYHHGYIYECIADVEYSLKYTPDPDDHDNKRDIAFNFVSPYTSDSQAMQAWLKNVIQLDKQDISFTEVASGSIIRKTFDDDRADSMWNVILRDKDGNVLYQSERGIYTSDLESFGFTFIWPNDCYLVDVPSSFTTEWSVASTSNYRWEQLNVQPNGSGGDLSIYQLKMNMTQDPNSTSQGTYPSSYALSEAVKATLTVFENNTGTVLETGLTLGNSVLVFINGSLLEAGTEADYIINGNQIIFSIPLQLTDKVTIINGNLRAIDLSPYQLKLGATNVITTGEGNVVGSVTADSGTVTVTKTTIEASKDYNELNNKPSINGVTLSGNKTADDLGLNAMATINFYESPSWQLDVTKTILTLPNVVLGNSVFVFKNGQLIQDGSGNDYTYSVSGSNSVITFTTALEDTDKVAVINGNLTGIDLTPYLTANDLLPYQQKAQIIEDDRAQVTSLAIQANKVYKFTNANITEISFASCEQSELVTKIDFTTGSSNVTFSDGGVIDWADGETPHFYAYQHYWIIISDKTGFVKEIY